MEKFFLSDQQLGCLTSDEQEQFILASGLCEGNILKFKEQYQNLDNIGNGSFGTVNKVFHIQKEIFQAMKCMPCMINDYKQNRIQILRELQIVQRMFDEDLEFRKSHYVLKCQKYFYQRKNDEVSGEVVFQLFFIYDLAQCDLNNLIESNRKMSINFSEEKVIIFLWQTLNGLQILFEKYQIRHRDLKPQNILVLENGIYLIADFTTCKVKLYEEMTHLLTMKKQIQLQQSFVVGTREYWPPEVHNLELNLNEINLKELNNGKVDIFQLAIVAICLLFHQTKAGQLTELQNKGEKINKFILSIKNINLKELLLKMSQWESKQRWDLNQSIEYFKQNFSKEIKQFQEKQNNIQNYIQLQQNQDYKAIVDQNEKQSRDIQLLKNKVDLYEQKQMNNKKDFSNFFCCFSQKNKKIHPQNPIKQSENIPQNPIEQSENITEFNFQFYNQQELKNSFQKKQLIKIVDSKIIWISISPNGNYLSAACEKGQIIWDTQNNLKCEIQNGYMEQDKMHLGTCFSYDNQFVCFTCHDSKKIYLYEFKQNQFVFADVYEVEYKLIRIQMSKKNLVLICSSSEKIYFFKIIQNSNKNYLELINQLGSYYKNAYGIALSNQNSNLAVSRYDGYLLLIDYLNLDQGYEFCRDVKIFSRAILFNENDDFIFIGDNSQINIFSIKQQKVITVLQGHQFEVKGIFLSLDNQYLYSIDSEGNFIQWIRSQNKQILTCSIINMFSLQKKISSNIQFNKITRQILFGSNDGDIITFQI